MLHSSCCLLFFFFNDTATTEIYTLSLHDALHDLVEPVGLLQLLEARAGPVRLQAEERRAHDAAPVDRKSTRLNSSHLGISYAVFCLKKKKKKQKYSSKRMPSNKESHEERIRDRE